MDYGPYTPSHKKARGRPSKPRKPSNILLLAAARSHRQCRCHPPHHKYNFIPSRPVNHLQSYLRPNVGRGTALLLLYFFSAICTCTCPCHICLYFVHVCIIWTCTVPSASALPILCYPSLSHNPTWPAQTIVILPFHTEGAHQFARNQIVKPHATAFRHKSF